jgi:hypothetical protein
MELYYPMLFVMVGIATAILQWKRGGGEKASSFPPLFIAFQNNYLFVYTLMMGSSRTLDPELFCPAVS